MDEFKKIKKTNNLKKENKYEIKNTHNIKNIKSRNVSDSIDNTEWSESSEETPIKIDTTPRSTSISKKLKWDQTPLGIVKTFGDFEYKNENKWDDSPLKKVKKAHHNEINFKEDVQYSLKEIEKLLPPGYEIFTPHSRYKRSYDLDRFTFLENHNIIDVFIIEHLFSISDGLTEVFDFSGFKNILINNGNQFNEEYLKLDELGSDDERDDDYNDELKKKDYNKFNNLSQYLKTGNIIKKETDMPKDKFDEKIEIFKNTKMVILSIKILNNLKIDRENKIFLLKNIQKIIKSKKYIIHRSLVLFSNDIEEIELRLIQNNIFTLIFNHNDVNSLLLLTKDFVKSFEYQESLVSFIMKLINFFGIDILRSFIDSISESKLLVVNLLYLNLIKNLHSVGVNIKINNLVWYLKYKETLKTISFCSNSSNDMMCYIDEICILMKNKNHRFYQLIMTTLSILIKSQYKYLLKNSKFMQSKNFLEHNTKFGNYLKNKKNSKFNQFEKLEKIALQVFENIKILNKRNYVKVFCRIYSFLPKDQIKNILLEIINKTKDKKELFKMTSFRKICIDFMKNNGESKILLNFMNYSEVLAIFINLKNIEFDENEQKIYFQNLRKYIEHEISIKPFDKKQYREFIDKDFDHKNSFDKNFNHKDLIDKDFDHKNFNHEHLNNKDFDHKNFDHKNLNNKNFDHKKYIFRNMHKLVKKTFFNHDFLIDLISITLNYLNDKNGIDNSLLIIGSILGLLSKDDLNQYLNVLFESLNGRMLDKTSLILGCIFKIIFNGSNLSDSQILSLAAMLKMRDFKVSYQIFKIIAKILDKNENGDFKNRYSLIKKREWLRIIHDCVDHFDGNSKIRKLSIECIGKISEIVSPYEVIYILVDVLKGKRKKDAALAIAEISRFCGIFSVLPTLLIEYSIPDYNLKLGILKSMAYIFDCKIDNNGYFKVNPEMDKYIPSLINILNDALLEKDIEFRRAGFDIVKNILIWYKNKEFAIHTLNLIFPNIFESKLKSDFDEIIQVFARCIGPDIYKYLSQGLWSGCKKIKSRYWEIFWIISESTDILILESELLNFNLEEI
ncbi:U2 snRNP component prp10 [Dictyocoela muelleri]|nr:U2 snRNP component prp10 [Dictyocoela muelleri]